MEHGAGGALDGSDTHSLVPWHCGHCVGGVKELREGRALIYNYTASRTERPFTFWTVILVFRFAIGAELLGAVVWRLALS